MMDPRKNDFSTGSVKRRIIAQAMPLTVAQAVQLLYNIVDRIYIGHLPEGGELALTGVGVLFPVIIVIAAFTNLFGSGGTTLFSIARGRGDEEEEEQLMGSAFVLLTASSVVIFLLFYLFRRPVLFLFGASQMSFPYADAYLKIYLMGTFFSMVSTGMNGFINAQGFPRIGMLTTVMGAAVNILLDPIFIFVLDLGIRGAALATVLSQALSALWVLRFLTGKKALLRLKRSRFRLSRERTVRIVSLGLPGFVVQGTNSLVQIVCNNQLQMYSADLYVRILTIVSSVREIVSLPVTGITHGAQPVLGYNYGAEQFGRVKEGIRFTAVLGMSYTLLAWIFVMLFPRQMIGLFTTDLQTLSVGAEMMNIYFFGFVFMACQFAGQTAFQSLGRAKRAIFFSLFRKVFIVVPLTLLLPGLGFGVKGVFLAEPISNVVGGLACFGTMWVTLYRKL